ncbi:hypothetical protein NL676_026372 [Syzygium grande]|nr:hypothetical protein NL676_026372 [Syzygium grande]
MLRCEPCDEWRKCLPGISSVRSCPARGGPGGSGLTSSDRTVLICGLTRTVLAKGKPPPPVLLETFCPGTIVQTKEEDLIAANVTGHVHSDRDHETNPEDS